MTTELEKALTALAMQRIYAECERQASHGQRAPRPMQRTPRYTVIAHRGEDAEITYPTSIERTRATARWHTHQAVTTHLYVKINNRAYAWEPETGWRTL